MNAHQQNVEDFRLKLLFEQKLAVKMRKIFTDMSQEAKAYYKSKGAILNIDHYDNEIKATLQAHYREVAKKFKKRLRLHIEKSRFTFDVKAVEDDIDTYIAMYIRKRANDQTGFIAATNKKELDLAFSKTLISSLITGKFMSQQDIADEGALNFENRAMGRASTIGLTETQNIAEATKDIEAFQLFNTDIVAGGVTLKREIMTKTWSAILDVRTREAHMEADDQTVMQDDPFIVMGEELMFPGDDSRGASLENIINCRCNTTRAIELAELPEWVFHPENRAPYKSYSFNKLIGACSHHRF